MLFRKKTWIAWEDSEKQAITLVKIAQTAWNTLTVQRRYQLSNSARCKKGTSMRRTKQKNEALCSYSHYIGESDDRKYEIFLEARTAASSVKMKQLGKTLVWLQLRPLPVSLSLSLSHSVHIVDKRPRMETLLLAVRFRTTNKKQKHSIPIAPV